MIEASDSALPPAHDSEQLLRLLVTEQENYAVVLLDEEGYIRTWNKGVEHLFGYTEPEFLGQHSSLIFILEDRIKGVPKHEMEMARTEGKASDIRWQQRKDGTRFFGQGVLTAVKNTDGAVIGFTKVVSDESVRKSLEDRLLLSNSELEQFAHVVSHDLQEPLRTVISYSELLRLRLGDKLDAETAPLFAFLESAAAEMRRLVRDLLAYSSLSAEEPHPVPIALDEVVEMVRTTLAKAISDSNATITHDALPVVSIDAAQAVRLLQNLIGNSIRYRRDGVPVEVHLSANREGELWSLAVADNGRGFDPERAEYIFEPFRRLHDRNVTGTGLGLAICRRIVERHGGRIWAESAGEDQGACFRFTLPAA